MLPLNPAYTSNWSRPPENLIVTGQYRVLLTPPNPATELAFISRGFRPSCIPNDKGNVQ